MTRFCTSHNNAKGFTLVELLVTVMVLSIIVAGLCDIFIANQKAWERQSGESDALGATSSALASLRTYVGNAMEWQTYTRFSQGDVLVISLPADTSHGIYVPTYQGGGQDGQGGEGLAFRRGQTIVFYLSDSTGSYASRGKILWAGTMAAWGIPAVGNVTPDASWSLYPGTTQGRITPIDSIQFTRQMAQRYDSVTMTVTSSYKAGSGTATMTRTRTVCLRSQVY